MYSSHSFIKIFLIFFVSMAIAGLCGWFYYSLKLNPLNLPEFKTDIQADIPVQKETQPISSLPDLPAQPVNIVPPPKVNLKNPFIPPPQFLERTSKGQVGQRTNLIVYQGIIETDKEVLALIKISSTNQTLIVHQGQTIKEAGIIIRKITSKSLSYTKDGLESVILLGGIKK